MDVFTVSNKCSLHGRCLPNFRPNIGALTEWQARKPESDIYRLCSQCPDYSPVILENASLTV